MKVNKMKNALNRNQSGFTLVELIVVIVILGILSAFAIPKFINLTQDARSATVEGVTGALRSAVNLVYARSVVDGTQNQPEAEVQMADGSTVKTVYGYPKAVLAEGITNALHETPSGFTVANEGGTAVSYTLNNMSDCKIRYQQATSTLPATVVAVSNCGASVSSGSGGGGQPVVVPPADNGSGVISIN